MAQTLYQVDAFTDRPFAGNPAAVCILDNPAEETWMQAIAAEMNLSETAFLHPEADGYRLRWFTPAIEVDLCGHATLASAHILWETGKVSPDTSARFHTRSGLLTAARRNDRIELDFPALSESPADAPDDLRRALNVSPVYAGKSRFDYVIEVENEATVRGLRPDFSLLAKVSARGIIVTSRSDSPDFDFVSRFFAPAAGIDEDPVTGSAHCLLGPFWQARLGKDTFRAYQASARGGIVHVQVVGDRVLLGGHAVTVLRGELLF